MLRIIDSENSQKVKFKNAFKGKHNVMILGLIGAMPEEVDGLKAMLSKPPYQFINTTQCGDRDYHHFQLGEHQIHLVFSRWGKVAAAITVTTLITRFNVEQIIFTGVAGAAAELLNIGDIVIGSEYIQHDMNAVPLFNKFFIPLTDICYFPADKALLDMAKQTVKGLLNKSKELAQLDVTEFNQQPLKVYTGTIASGDQFIADKQQVKQLSVEINNLQAVDMESAAVAHVCSDHNIPYVAIRIMSDKVDGTAHVEYGKFVQTLATPMTTLIIQALLKNYLVGC